MSNFLGCHPEFRQLPKCRIGKMSHASHPLSIWMKKYSKVLFSGWNRQKLLVVVLWWEVQRCCGCAHYVTSAYPDRDPRLTTDYTHSFMPILPLLTYISHCLQTLCFTSYVPLKRRNKNTLHLVLFCDFLGPVFIQWESTSTSEVLLLALRTLARWCKGELEWAQAAGCSIRYD
jgi:hypothetical protein